MQANLATSVKIFCSILMVFLTIGFSKGNQMEQIHPSHTAIRYIGRIDTTNAQEYQFAYPGITIQAEFSAKKVVALLQGHSSTRDNNYFNLYIDGKFERVIRISNELKSYTLYEGEQIESHVIKLVKRTEARLGIVSFFGFETDGVINRMRMPTKKLKIEFIGNSITCGYGIEALNQNAPFRGKTENVTKSYAYVAAERLNAEAHFTAFSGKGMYRNFGERPDQSPDMLDLHEVVMPQRKIKWEYYRFIPHIVVINLGSNDFAPPMETNPHEFTKEYFKLVERIIAQYGDDCDIYCLNGPMLAEKESKIVESCLLKVMNTYREQGKPNIFYFRLSHQNGSTGFGANWHPSSQQGLLNAIELSKYIEVNSL